MRTAAQQENDKAFVNRKIARRATRERDVIVFLKANPWSNTDEIYAGTKVCHGDYPLWCLERKKKNNVQVYAFSAIKFERRMQSRV